MKLKYDQLLSNFAFNCNLRHYNAVAQTRLDILATTAPAAIGGASGAAGAATTPDLGGEEGEVMVFYPTAGAYTIMFPAQLSLTRASLSYEVDTFSGFYLD